jgi:hypothetical protein
MKNLLTSVARYRNAWNRVYLKQVYQEEEPYLLEQIAPAVPSGVTHGQTAEVESLAKSRSEESPLPIQAGLHRPL